MSLEIACIDGKGSVTEPSPGTFQTAGMDTADHMRIEKDYIDQAGVIKIFSDFIVDQKSTPDLSVNIAPGVAYVLNSSFVENSVNQTKFWRATNTGEVNVAINSNISGNPRITSIFIKVDTVTTPNDDADNVVSIIAVDGTAAASPTPPATPSNHLRLADVYVANGASSIINSNITDQRVEASLMSTKVTPNLIKNGNCINNSTNGYGNEPDDWIDDGNANPVQGGMPVLTKEDLISILGITTSQIEGLWNLKESSGNAIDLSDNGYDLTDNNTVGSSQDGLMSRARDFELSNSEYLDIPDASCPNLEISGSQTWFAYAKLESIAPFMRVMARRNATTGKTKSLHFVSGQAAFRLEGLITNDLIVHDAISPVDKWYFICGIYDSANSKLKIWVNGIKKEVTATGSASDTNADFAIGADFSNVGDTPQYFFDGLIQNACILSVALTDNQVKRLWAYTNYKGLKIRRSGIDGEMSQGLPQNLVEQYRGKQISFGAEMFQDVSSIGQIEIDDGMSQTISTVSDITDIWLNPRITHNVHKDATEITIKLKTITSNGNVWFKRCSLNPGNQVNIYSPSQNDISRFPRLLDMNPPAVLSGYQFEEKRWYNYSPTYLANGSMTWTSVVTNLAKFKINNQVCEYHISAVGTTGGIASNQLQATYPITPASYITSANEIRTGSVVNDGGAQMSGFSSIDTVSTTILSSKYDNSNFGLGASRRASFQINIPID